MSDNRFELLQKFEGTIETVEGSLVVAVLRDLTDRTRPDEILRLEVDEFDSEDRDLLEPGTVFYWSIGYKIITGRTRLRSSLLRVRRLPPRGRRSLERADAAAHTLARSLGVLDD